MQCNTRTTQYTIKRQGCYIDRNILVPVLDLARSEKIKDESKALYFFFLDISEREGEVVLC